jgi:hypothetical protein
MKRIALLATTVLFAGAGNAAEIRNSITQSVQLKVVPAVTIQTPTAASYSVSGDNINVTTLGKVGTAGSYAIQSNGDPFTFTEANLTAGTVTQTQTGGTAGALAGTITVGNGGGLTVTAGGSGTEAIGQYAIELSVFQ